MLDAQFLDVLMYFSKYSARHQSVYICSFTAELKHAELNSTGSVTVNSIRKLNYPLTPSSDTSDPPTSIMSDLIITSIPGESGDSLTPQTRLTYVFLTAVC